MTTPTTVFECIAGTIADCLQYFPDSDPKNTGCAGCLGNYKPTESGTVGTKTNYNCSAQTSPIENCDGYDLKGCAECKDGFAQVNATTCSAPTAKIDNCLSYSGVGTMQVCSKCKKGFALTGFGSSCSASTAGCYFSITNDPNQCSVCDAFNGRFAIDFKNNASVCTAAYSFEIRVVTVFFITFLGLTMI
jgi:hypothetical protein